MVRQAITPTSTVGYITIGQAMDRSGWTNSKILRHSLIGEIRTLILPGRYPVYHSDDLDAVIAAEGPAVKRTRREPVSAA